MTKRVTLLTQFFEPEPTFKGLAFARALASRGYEVEGVTGFPNYPGGRLYPGYKIAPIRREVIEGIRVTRLPLYPSHDDSPLRRVLNYVSFAGSSLVYCLFAAPRTDVIYVYQLLTTGLVAVIVQAIRGTPFVLDVQDIWPDTLSATGMMRNARGLRIVDRVAKFVYSKARAVAVQSEGFRRLLIDRGVPPAKIKLIPNWCDEQSLLWPVQSEASEFPPREKFRILFAGNLGKLQALESVLDAAELLRETHPGIAFVLLGGGIEVENLKRIANSRSADNVVFLPRVGMNQVGAYLREADAVIVHLKAHPLFAITIPGKVQAYMAMGKPILIAVDGDAAELVRKAGAGISAAPQDPSAIANAAIQLASLPKEELCAMGERGRAFYFHHLCLAKGVDAFAELFEAVTQPT